MKLAPNDKIFCPHCNEQQEGVAKDYVIPGQVGLASAAETQCGDCDERFNCRTLKDGTIEVED